MKRALLTVVALCALAGCASDSNSADTTSTPTTVATTSTTTASTTTTMDPIAAGQALYFVISSKVNAANTQAYANHRRGDVIPWSRMPAFCAEYAPAVEQFANDVQAGPWPESAQDEADELARAVAASAGQLYACAAATSASGAQAAMADGSIESADQAASSAMRLALGLPIDRS